MGEGGLICYTYPQSLADPDKFEALSKTPFVWKREDGSTALVQTWPTKFNDEFKKGFSVTEKNPDPSTFDPQAEAEFRTAMKNMFSEADVNEEGIFKFCHKKTKNDQTVYVGKSEDIMQKLKDDESILEQFKIDSIGKDGEGKDDPLAMTVLWEDKKQN